MIETVLFNTKNGPLTNFGIVELLKKIGAQEADVLYIHTALNFGIPNRQLKKSELLESIYEVLLSLNVDSIIFPTYTFSFCNGNVYDVQQSKTPMGLFNDYVRVQQSAIRSEDPLMSNVLIGKHEYFVKDIGKNSVGKNSTFDLIHLSNLKIKFLFLGPKMGDCFTYMHYIEEERNVPYRYNRTFSGEIINDKGETYADNYELFVRYSNVFAGDGSYIYENIMFERGISKRISIGDGLLSIVEEKPAYDCYVELLNLSPSFYITEPFEPLKNTTDFIAVNMVAL